MRILPDGEVDTRNGETALAVALGGVICPVPFLMSGAALQIARPRRSRLARAAAIVAVLTIIAQAVGLLALGYVLLR